MNGNTVANLRVYTDGGPDDGAAPPPCDPHELANRELIRPHTYRRGPKGPEPLSAGWFEEVEQRRYARHGAWLPAALELGRHPGESVLILNPGLGTDAVQYERQGSVATVAAGPADHPDLVRANLQRRGSNAPVHRWDGRTLGFPFGTFDVVVWNALHVGPADPAAVAGEAFRVLKAGGKLIGLFPARYDAGYWQDLVLPLQYLYWRRPPDPTTTPKTTARGLHRLFSRFDERRVVKRHLRRSELPHLWRTLPLLLLERLIGRVLVVKALKPLSAWRGSRPRPAASPSRRDPTAAAPTARPRPPGPPRP